MMETKSENFTETATNENDDDDDDDEQTDDNSDNNGDKQRAPKQRWKDQGNPGPERSFCFQIEILNKILNSLVRSLSVRGPVTLGTT